MVVGPTFGFLLCKNKIVKNLSRTFRQCGSFLVENTKYRQFLLITSCIFSKPHGGKLLHQFQTVKNIRSQNLLFVMFLASIYKLFFRFSVPSWFLLSNGHDTSDCGLTPETACKTLDWLLARFENYSYMIHRTLNLITDTSLIIDQDLVVSLEPKHISKNGMARFL